MPIQYSERTVPAIRCFSQKLEHCIIINSLLIVLIEVMYSYNHIS